MSPQLLTTLKGICCKKEEEQKMNILILPDEIFMMIFSHLSVIDQEQASGVCRRFREILRDKHLYRVTSLYKEYSCTKEMFHRVMKPRCKNIVHLDLTSCYWLTSSEIYKSVVKMEKLESLYAADTQLNIFHITQLVYKLTYLRRLSFNWASDPIGDTYPLALADLDFLYIYVTEWGNYVCSLLKWLENCKNLKELWILSFGNGRDRCVPIYRKFSFSFPSLEKLVISVTDVSSYIIQFLRDIAAGSVSARSLDCMWLGFHDPFSKYCPTEEQLRNVKFLHPYPPIVHIPTQSLRNVHTVVTANFSETDYPSLTNLRILLRPTLPNNDIEPAVINKIKTFMCTMPCFSTYIDEFIILLSPDNKLRKITLKYFHESGAVSDQKRQIEEYLLAVNRSCPQIEEMEIRGCPICITKFNPTGEHLSEIGKLKNLRKITLHNLNILDGRFIIQIASGCEYLESISLNNLGLQGNCIYLPEICIALKTCKFLKDFRLQHANVGKLDMLWEQLKQCTKLERVVIHSDRNRVKPNQAHMIDFIVKSPRLVFFVCAMPSITQQQVKVINKAIKERCLKQRPALIVKVSKELDENKSVFGIIHLAEMMYPHPPLGPVETSVHVTGLPEE